MWKHSTQHIKLKNRIAMLLEHNHKNKQNVN